MRVAQLAIMLVSPGILAAGFAVPTPSPSGISEGELLVGELNCIACHTAKPSTAARLAPRSGPILGSGGLRLPASWLKAWLGDHEHVKPGSGMPDLLHGLDPATREDAVEALTHYLSSIAPTGPATPSDMDSSRLAQGKEAYHRAGCVACHAPFESVGNASAADIARATEVSIPLGDLSRKYYVSELAQFLKDPVKHREGGRMPSLNLTDTEALAISTYLLRDQAAPGNSSGTNSIVPGLKVEYFEGDFHSCKDLDGATAKTVSFSDGIPTKIQARDSDFGLRVSGIIDVPKDGEYTFWTQSDDGSTIDIDGKRVVNNDGEHGTATANGVVNLAAGKHAFELRFFQKGGGYELFVTWAGPGFPRQRVARSVLKRQAVAMKPVGEISFNVDTSKAEKGKEWFTKLNCAACHRVTGKDVPEFAGTKPPTLVAVSKQPTQGCLAEKVPSTAPKFSLSSSQRSAIRKALSEVAALENPLSAGQQATLTMAKLNCYACHARDGFGGADAGSKSLWFAVVGEADLGDEGRIPPALTGVGAKLRSAWLGKVLGTGEKVRPYMATRMPVFGTHNVGHLIAAFETADARANVLPEPQPTERDAKIGRKLVGRDGLSCISCHTFGTHPSLGIPALSLDRMHERLRWDWFRRYLPDPAALRPGTRMPSFWPEGKAVNVELAHGDTQEQIAAIWAWMNDGSKAPIPAGLVRAQREITVGKEAVIYRNFIEGAGPRAIGVGYPERANLAFDANQLRLAMIWQGAFIDSARHSNDRGVGFEPPLGDRVIHFPEGPAFAVLASPDAPWPAASPRSVESHFLGYALDPVRRPTFRYTVGSLTIEDYPTAKESDLDVVLTRSIKVTGSKPEAGQLWFRAAAGDIKRQPNGSFLVDGLLRIQFDEKSSPVVVGRELRVPIQPDTEVTLQMTW